MAIINVNNLKKVYKTYERKEGLLAAFVSLFKRKYKEVVAAKNVSFEINEGEVVGFIGPNGAGKSTVIKMLTGLLHPTAGDLSVMNYTPFKDRHKYVQNIGVVFGQKSQLWWDLPPVDAFALLKEIYGVPEKEFNKRLKYMTKMLEIEKIGKTPVRNLSLGERMRCEVIAALMHNPKVVFLDEPTIGLDVVAKDRIRAFIKDVNKKYNTTFIITTHDMDDIEELCKRVIVIDRGTLIYDGLLENLKKKYIKYKVILVEFGSPVKKCLKLKGIETNCKDDYHMEIKLDISIAKISKIIAKVMKNYPVKDIIISEPKIEEIIKTMYREG